VALKLRLIDTDQRHAFDKVGMTLVCLVNALFQAG
jgi:hypothetical protein